MNKDKTIEFHTDNYFQGRHHVVIDVYSIVFLSVWHECYGWKSHRIETLGM